MVNLPGRKTPLSRPTPICVPPSALPFTKQMLTLSASTKSEMTCMRAGRLIPCRILSLHKAPLIPGNSITRVHSLATITTATAMHTKPPSLPRFQTAGHGYVIIVILIPPPATPTPEIPIAMWFGSSSGTKCPARSSTSL